MKRIFFALALISLVVSGVHAQISSGGTPPDFLKPLKNTKPIKTLNLKKIQNINELLAEDKEFPTPFRYAIRNPVNIDIKEQGTLRIDEEGNRIWKYKISAEEAFSLNLIFSDYHLPKRAKLWIYTPDHQTLLGSFTSYNNKGNGNLPIQEIPGKEAIIEYVEPQNPEFEGSLILGSVGQAYKDLFSVLVSDNRNIDINCFEGDNWQLEKHAVAKITFTDDLYSYLCSGALINNTSSDGTPYFVTAYHCLNRPTTASTVVAYFNYELSDCGGFLEETQTISGAFYKSSNSSADFTLLELKEVPPPDYQPYYAGWDVSDNRADMSVAIHHPKGDFKKFSIDYDSLLTYPFDIQLDLGDSETMTIPYGNAWYVVFEEGGVQQGSSGSPIFNSKSQIVGLLSASSAEDYDSSALYGKISSGWTRQTQLILDPSLSNEKSTQGYFPADNVPDANFITSFKDVCTGAVVNIYDASLFNPTSREWLITPDSYTLVNGTNLASEMISVIFNEEAQYDISLTVSKGEKSNTQKHGSYINVGSGINADIYSYSYNPVCLENYKDILVVGKGGTQYDWITDTILSNYFTLSPNFSGDSVYVNINSSASLPDSTITGNLYGIASHGECTDTAFYELYVLQHSNDNIEDALSLTLNDTLGPFGNACAGIEENEPLPPIGDCMTQGEWCGCEVDGLPFLNNSIWFSFTAPESGMVGVETYGYDNQIAIYEAESVEDILSGDDSRYDIIGANDDFEGKESDYSARVPSINVTPGKTYWIQSDGSACGTWGDMYIFVSDYQLSSVEQITASQEKLNIYPNPANEKIYIHAESIPEHEKMRISVFSIDGKKLLQKDIQPKEWVGIENLNPGLYIIKAEANERIYSGQFIKK